MAGATGGLGAVVGPVLGSLLIDVASWRWIFWVNVPAKLAANVIEPPMAWTTRAAISQPTPGASAHSSDPTPNRATPGR
ncbi:MAG: MFS transporter [Actinomycetota bacterium]